MTRIEQAASPAQIAAIQGLLVEYRSWTRTLGVDTEDVPTFDAFDAEIATLPGVFAPPGGRLLLATEPEGPAGCVALIPLRGDTGELKRLYVRPAFRGRGIGPQLVAALLTEARTAGYTRIELDSHRSMAAAHAIYRAAGFVDEPPPPDFPARLLSFVVFVGCDLRPRT